jgi:DNA-binding NtrC family response regulator
VSALPQLLQLSPNSRIVMMTAYQTVDSIVSAMKSGAVDYLVKPLHPDMILQAIDKYSALSLSSLHKPPIPSPLLERGGKKESEKKEIRFVAHSALMKNVLAVADKFASSDWVVLLLGESGTGKELLAQYIHQKSRRHSAPFVVVDCASIPESLFESELFGYEKGAFTGADTAKIGRLELANGGTLFLDEIGNVPMTLQSKLLRFIQEHTLFRLGSKTALKLDIRLITATNENLQQLILNGKFREDLYYRLSALPIHLPPLRNRPKEEKEYLVHHFLKDNQARLGKPALRVSEPVLHAIMEYPWPGNIRELENALYSASLLCDGDVLEITHLPVSIQSYFEHKKEESFKISESSDKSLRKILEKVEKEKILSVLQQTQGNKKKAADILDMDYKNLLSKIKKYSKEKGQN